MWSIGKGSEVIRGLSTVQDVPLRTRRALSLYKVYGDSTLLVLNRTSLNIDSALLTLKWQNINEKVVLPQEDNNEATEYIKMFGGLDL